MYNTLFVSPLQPWTCRCRPRRSSRNSSAARPAQRRSPTLTSSTPTRMSWAISSSNRRHVDPATSAGRKAAISISKLLKRCKCIFAKSMPKEWDLDLPWTGLSTSSSAKCVHLLSNRNRNSTFMDIFISSKLLLVVNCAPRASQSCPC